MIKLEQVSNDRTALLRELERLRAENRMLRARRPQSRRYSQTVNDAIADANQMIMCAWSGEVTGCEHMRNVHGMTRTRWDWACALLRMAKVIQSGRHWQAGHAWLVDDLSAAISMLDATAAALDDHTGYQKLKAARVQK